MSSLLQHFILGFEGLEVPTYISKLISKGLSGVILFKRNIQSKDQLKDLITQLKSYENLDRPLFISVDHEGGRVFRLPEPFTKIPTARELAKQRFAEGGEELIKHTAHLMAKELSEVGFNLNYAPLIDVDSNPINPIIGDRSFSSNPQIVAQLGLELIKGLRDYSVFPCAKHFPGHGDTSLDSHLDLPIVEADLETLWNRELIPFQAAIKEKVETIMTAHVLYPAFDAEFPATLSSKIIQGLLRDKLGYEGVVISDDFIMKAIADRYGLAEAVELFFHAGGDIALICHEEEIQMKVIESTEERIKQRAISLEKMAASAARIRSLRLKI